MEIIRICHSKHWGIQASHSLHCAIVSSYFLFLSRQRKRMKLSVGCAESKLVIRRRPHLLGTPRFCGCWRWGPPPTFLPQVLFIPRSAITLSSGARDSAWLLFLSQIFGGLWSKWSWWSHEEWPTCHLFCKPYWEKSSYFHFLEWQELSHLLFSGEDCSQNSKIIDKFQCFHHHTHWSFRIAKLKKQRLGTSKMFLNALA